MTISPEKKQQLVEIGGLLGELIGSLIGDAIIAGVFYAILVFLIGVSVTYLQVLGATLLFSYIKNFIKK